MIIEGNDIQRLGVYSFYDKDGIVDRYVEYFLQDFVKNITMLIIVINGEISSEEKIKFQKFTDHIIVRENKGFDIWGYKTGMAYVGWEKLVEYDEVVTANNTMMGPVYPFSEMFQDMAKKDLDFWGITKHYAFDFDPFGSNEYGYIPDHIQSYFVVFRKSFTKTKDFQNYWDNLPELNSYEAAIGKHETSFTKKFADKGFAWDTYVYTDDIKDLNQNLIMVYPKLLIEEKRCPIFKRRSFFQNYEYMLANTAGQPTRQLMDYLKNENLYDVDMIWENLLRTCNQADFVQNLHLQEVLSSEIAPEEEIKGILKEKKIALVMHLYFEDLVEKSYAYAKAMPSCTDVYITTNTSEKKAVIEEIFCQGYFNKCEVRIIENRGRDVSSILVGVKDVIMNYDIACFVHDKKTAQIKPGSVGDSFAFKCFSNTLYNQTFTRNVIKYFVDNPRVGIMSPPEPHHGEYYPIVGNEWTQNYDITCELAKKLGITVPMSEDKEPISPMGTFFWFRPKAFKIFYDADLDYNDFPPEPNKIDGTILHAFERIYPFAAQQAGYYPAILMVDKLASMEITNLHYYVREYNKVFWKNNKASYQYNMVKILDEQLKVDIHDYETLKQENMNLRNSYDAISNSVSWKIVSKVNRLIDRLKGK